MITFILILDGPESGDVCLSVYRSGCGDIRLSGYSSGCVHVFLSGMWLPVADSNMSWTMTNTEVVCRQLGYDTNSM